MIIITIPAYNEEKTIGGVIKEIKEVMDKTNYKYEICVLDDGSRDKTKIIAEKLGAIVFSHPINYGLAETFKEEIRKCLELKADIIIHTDADGQYPAIYIPELIKEIENGYDLVLGSRFKGKIQSMSLIKRIGNIIFSKVISQITKTKITDAQTGFRAFTKNTAKIQITSDHTYTQEQIIRAVKNKFKIKEIPIYARKTRKSKLIKNPFEYAIKAGINLLRVYRDFKPLKFFGSISFFLFFLSFIIILYSILRMIISGLNILDRIIPTLLFAVLFFLTGLQILLFGFLADQQKI